MPSSPRSPMDYARIPSKSNRFDGIHDLDINLLSVMMSPRSAIPEDADYVDTPMSMDTTGGIMSPAHNYISVKHLGSGSQAEVKLALRSTDNQLVVLKTSVHCLSDMTTPERLDAFREAELMASFNHDSIIMFLDSFLADDALNIVMEYANSGSLHQYLVNCKELLHEDHIWQWFAQLVNTVHYLHTDKKILHRDLKTTNVLLHGVDKRSKGQIKLADFGLAAAIDSGTKPAAEGIAAEGMGAIIGTPFYLSPELCQGEPSSTKSDMWALGCILYEMTTLRRPFEGSNFPAVMMAIARGKRAPIDKRYSEELRDMISACLHPTASARPSIEAVSDHPKVKEAWITWTLTHGSHGTPGASPASRKSAIRSMSRMSTRLRLQKSSSVQEIVGKKEDSAAAVASFHSAEIVADLAAIAIESRSGTPRSKPRMVTRLGDVRTRVKANPHLGTGEVWEGLGRSFAEVGEFDAAIDSYREALATKAWQGSPCRILVIEQLGNLLTRRAQTMWSANQANKSRAGAAEWAGRDEAVALMTEGMDLLERLCLLGKTGERMCLLASAYKRRARTGLGGRGRKADLKSARDSYAFAHEVEMRHERSGEAPNPYARLNELTFELLAGDPSRGLGKEITTAKMWSEARLASAVEKDVWQLVQSVDADLLLGMIKVGEAGVSKGVAKAVQSKLLGAYSHVLISQGSPRVWASVIDQFEFICEMLQSRAEEETADPLANARLLRQCHLVDGIARDLKLRGAALDRTTDGKSLASSPAATTLELRSSLSATLEEIEVEMREAEAVGSVIMDSDEDGASTEEDEMDEDHDVATPLPYSIGSSLSASPSPETAVRVRKPLAAVSVPSPASVASSAATRRESNASVSSNPFSKASKTRRPSEMVGELRISPALIQQGFFKELKRVHSNPSLLPAAAGVVQTSTKLDRLDRTAFRLNTTGRSRSRSYSKWSSYLDPWVQEVTLSCPDDIRRFLHVTIRTPMLDERRTPSVASKRPMSLQILQADIRRATRRKSIEDELESERVAGVTGSPPTLFPARVDKVDLRPPPVVTLKVHAKEKVKIFCERATSTTDLNWLTHNDISSRPPSACCTIS